MIVEQILEKVRERGKVTKKDVCEYLTVIRDETDEQIEPSLTQFLNSCPDVDVSNEGITARERAMSGWRGWLEEIFPPIEEKVESQEESEKEDSLDEAIGTQGEEKFAGPDVEEEDAPDDA